LIRDLQQFPAAARGGAVSVGNFDGVHRGHAALMARLVSMAASIGGPAVAITFDPHPAAFLRPESLPPQLTEIDRRAELLQACGVDYVVVCRTSPALLRQSAVEFFRNVLIESVAARGMVEGPNFYFGRNREGNRDTLAELCRQHAMRLEIVAPTRQPTASNSTEAGAKPITMISSSEIRRRLLAGEIAAANDLLTAPYRLRGRVVRGDSRGKGLGFPTANLDDIPTLVPGAGVYATVCHLDGRRFLSATHIGPNPTFDLGGGGKVEVHLLDFEGDLYDRTLEIELIARVRDIVRFPSVDQLVRQLGRDMQTTRDLLQYV
jgi:riboflavin kinase/FMN adenylyltransferase